MELAGKVAVVTGASSGIGEATARALAAAGMTVVAVARRADRLEQLAAGHPGIVAHAADVTDDEAIAALTKHVEEEHSACHVLVNNAGAHGEERFWGSEHLDDFRATIELNLMGTVRCTAHFAALLEASAPARVINVASVAGKVGVGPVAYVTSKFATVGFSEALASSWARRGITVTQLNPGFVRTEGFPQRDLVANPLTRRLVGTPEVVARAIVDAARRGQHERTTPRWYRPIVVSRHVAAPAFWAVARRLRR